MDLWISSFEFAAKTILASQMLRRYLSFADFGLFALLRDPQAPDMPAA